MSGVVLTVICSWCDREIVANPNGRTHANGLHRCSDCDLPYRTPRLDPRDMTRDEAEYERACARGWGD